MTATPPGSCQAAHPGACRTCGRCSTWTTISGTAVVCFHHGLAACAPRAPSAQSRPNAVHPNRETPEPLGRTGEACQTTVNQIKPIRGLRPRGRGLPPNNLLPQSAPDSRQVQPDVFSRPQCTRDDPAVHADAPVGRVHAEDRGSKLTKVLGLPPTPVEGQFH